LRNGVVRRGTIESLSATELRMKLEGDGIEATVVIPMGNVARIVKGDMEIPKVAPVPSGAPLATMPSTTMPGASGLAATEAELERYRARGFLAELAASAAGVGPDDPGRLPAEQRRLWEQVLTVEKAGKGAETLTAMAALEEAMRPLPGGTERLNAMARRERREEFGAWMARVRWDVIGATYGTGQFALHDVREIERMPLVGILRQKTAAALDPLRPYFPPLDEKTGRPVAFRPAQLQGISTGNALEVKDKALFAAAVLRAQLTLEPGMPAVDRALLSGQLGTVNRVLSRARELEAAAKAALAKAERERKLAEEKARREAAKQRQKGTAGAR